MILFDLRRLRMICGKHGSLEALLLNKTVLWCPVRAFGPVFESTGTNLKRSHSQHVLLETFKRQTFCRVCSTWSQGSHRFLQAEVLGQVDLIFHLNFSSSSHPFSHLQFFHFFPSRVQKVQVFPSESQIHMSCDFHPVVLLVVTRPW